ncbi:MAG: zinc ribbon domain-containing protein [Mycobacterium sp.]|nr:zinc ribbon domain-containing protein [Mycobacterium sp.]
MNADRYPSTVRCPACHSTVAATVFCGNCGADTDAAVSRWDVLLRPKVYATACREPVWLPGISSTLFPRLPGRARAPFRVGLVGVLAAIVVLSLLRVNGPLGVIATIGWPLLFWLYMWQSDAFRDIGLRILAVTMVLGMAIGVGWWLSTVKLLAASYGVSTGSVLALLGVINTAFLLSVGGGLLMLVPAVVARLMAGPVRESLDGFVIGAFGALWYATAATTTILAPQFVEGLIEEHSAARMLDDSIRNGVVNPIVTTAAGGLVGLVLWFRPEKRSADEAMPPRMAVILCAVLGVGCYIAVWAVDAAPLPRAVELGLQLALSVLALLTVRCGVQIALLHEAPDPQTDAPILCVYCEKVVPDRAFCGCCGAAARAASRSSRVLRRRDRPVLQRAAR